MFQIVAPQVLVRAYLSRPQPAIWAAMVASLESKRHRLVVRLRPPPDWGANNGSNGKLDLFATKFQTLREQVVYKGARDSVHVLAFTASPCFSGWSALCCDEMSPVFALR